ncbi:MAG: DUF1326 domain-containing protein [Actinomycetota bacterium]|nr:DUF1326 domain-containing protein [Actinomycetota bacterium]
MATTWRITGNYLELCNCDPGCGCNFRGFPSSPEGNCEALVAVQVEKGSFGDIDLAGSKVAWALWWPKAIHDGGGKGHAYVDVSSDEQFEALATIYRGEAGYSYFEIFNSMFTEPTTVDRATVEFVLDGKSSRFSVQGVGEGVMEPLRNPVTAAENNVRIVKRDGFIWKDAEIVQGSRLNVDLPEMSFDLSGRHGVVSTFDWSSEKP